ncbi:hypothetical protein [Kribbella capetownensis]|nr:hypothetical protein [Kribbella capetownensis]
MPAFAGVDHVCLSVTELTTGLDHLGMAASSRDELVEWERRSTSSA